MKFRTKWINSEKLIFYPIIGMPYDLVLLGSYGHFQAPGLKKNRIFFTSPPQMVRTHFCQAFFDIFDKKTSFRTEILVLLKLSISAKINSHIR